MADSTNNGNASGNTGNMGGSSNPNNGFMSDYQSQIDIFQSSKFQEGQSNRQQTATATKLLRAQRGEIPWDDDLRAAAKLQETYKSINNFQRATITNLNRQNVIMQTIMTESDTKARKALERQLKATQQAYADEQAQMDQFRKTNAAGYTQEQNDQMKSILEGTKNMYKSSASAFEQTFGEMYQNVFDKVQTSQMQKIKSFVSNLSDTFEKTFINNKLVQLTSKVSSTAQQAVLSEQQMRNNTGWGTQGTNVVNSQTGNIMSGYNNKYSRSEIQSMMADVQRQTNNRNAGQVSGITKALLGENSSNPQAVSSIMDMVTKSQNGGNPVKTARTWSNIERGLRRSGITGVNSSEAIKNADASMDSIMIANNNNRGKSQRAQKRMAIDSSVAMANMGGRGQSIFSELTAASSGDYNALNSLQGVGVTQNMLQAYNRTGDPSKILQALSGRLKSFGGNTAAMKSYLSGIGLNFSDQDIAGLTQFNSSKYNQQVKSATSTVNSSIKNNSAQSDITKNNDARNGNIFQQASNAFSNSFLPKLFGTVQNKTGITTGDMFNTVNQILLYVKLIATSDLLSKGKDLFSNLKNFTKNNTLSRMIRNYRHPGGGSGGGGGSVDDVIDDMINGGKDTTKEAGKTGGFWSRIKQAWSDTKSGKGYKYADAAAKEAKPGFFTRSKNFTKSSWGKLLKLFGKGGKAADVADDTVNIAGAASKTSKLAKFGKLSKFSKLGGKGFLAAIPFALDMMSGKDAEASVVDSTIGLGHGITSKKDSTMDKGLDIFGGAATGATAGAALGSIIPGLGTLVGGLGGAVVGGTASAIGGKNLMDGFNKGWDKVKKTTSKGFKWITSKSRWKSFTKVGNRIAKGFKSVIGKALKGVKKSWKGISKWWKGLFKSPKKPKKPKKRSKSSTVKAPNGGVSPSKKSSNNNSNNNSSSSTGNNGNDNLRAYNKKLQGLDWSTQQDLGFSDIWSARSIVKDAASHSHKKGLSRVPKDGYIATLHKDEMVVPAKKAATLRANGYLDKGGTSRPSNSVNTSNTNKRGDTYNFNNPVTAKSKLMSNSLTGQIAGTLAGGSSLNYLTNLFKNAKYDKDALEVPETEKSSGNNPTTTVSGTVPKSEAKFAKLPLNTDFGASDSAMRSFAKRTSYRVNSLYHMNGKQIDNVTHYVRTHGFSPELWWAYEANEGGNDDWLNHYSGRSSSYGAGVKRTLSAFKPYMKSHIKLATSKDTSLGPGAYKKFKALPSGSIGLLYVQETAAASAGYTGGDLGKYGDPIKQSMQKIKAMGGKSSKYKQGTPWVPDTQVALLHKGEAVVPASKNPFSSSGKAKDSSKATKISSNNDDVVSTLKWAVKELVSAIQSTDSSSKNTNWTKAAKQSAKNIDPLDLEYRF